MYAAEEIERTLREVLPPDLHPMATLVAPLLADVARGVISIDELQQRLQYLDRTRLAEALAGQDLRTPSAVISFGAGSETGDMHIGDVAGRDIIKLNIVTGTIERPDPDLRRPATVYLCHAESGTPCIEALRLHLTLRGMPVVPQSADMSSTVSLDHAALHTAAVCLLHVTPNRLTDERAFEHDIATILAAARRRTLPVLVLRDGVSLRDIRPYVNLAHTSWIDIDLDSYGATHEANLDRIAAKVLDVLLTTHESHLLDNSGLKLGFYTSPPRGPVETPALLIDWEPCYKPRYPGLDEWRDLLLPALVDLRASLGRTAMHHIELHAFIRLAPAVALGYAFREVTGTQFRLRQREAYWHTARHDLSACPLDEVMPNTIGSGPDITVELNVTQVHGKVSRDVEQYLLTTSLPVGRRVALERPKDMSNHLSEAQAQAIASQIRTVIQTYRQLNGVVHLFMAVPFGLALLIGWQLNALTPVQCYELPEGATTYAPACRLDQI